MTSLDAVKLQLADELQTAKPANEVLPVALLMCQLSEQVYDPKRLHQKLLEQWQIITISGLAGLPDQEYRAKLIGSQLAAPDDKSKRQFALWIVPTVGFVAAFRGSADFADVCTDLDFSAEPLSNCRGTEIHLHGGMLRGVPQTVQSVLALHQQHKQEWQELPLYWTGSSLHCTHPMILNSGHSFEVKYIIS